jgi:hypothetical protein
LLNRPKPRTLTEEKTPESRWQRLAKALLIHAMLSLLTLSLRSNHLFLANTQRTDKSRYSNAPAPQTNAIAESIQPWAAKKPRL